MTPAELREHRIALHLTQQAMADRIGLTREMVGLMERGLKQISPRTEAAVLAAFPEPLDRRTTQFEPLLIRLEKALLAARILYTTAPEVDGEAVIFRLHDPDLTLYVATSRSDAPRKMATDFDSISIIGKSAVNAFITMLQHGGVHARLKARHDAYEET